ncbi:trehalase [Cellulophaga lytica]|uniref:MGH1-like glycoside hydrolase domain-containing protein n=1 Tax=Cellulophaga lytica TaxID=979 RepID=UPI0032E44149
MTIRKLWTYSMLALMVISCNKKEKQQNTPPNFKYLNYSKNVLNYSGEPKTKNDRSSLVFSDQGAWFGYSLKNTSSRELAHSGPFLMTQENGVWLSPALTRLHLSQNGKPISAVTSSIKEGEKYSLASHLQQEFTSNDFLIKQQLVFLNEKTALHKTRVKNNSNQNQTIEYWLDGSLFKNDMELTYNRNLITITSNKSSAIGYIKLPKEMTSLIIKDTFNYETNKIQFTLPPNTEKEITFSHSFLFPSQTWKTEDKLIKKSEFDSVLKARKKIKNTELSSIFNNLNPQIHHEASPTIISKAHLTLQNNWRTPAGELKHAGLFPSYHYEWFHGFWSWDSWKHAVGLSFYNIDLAKDQIRAMYDYQQDNGFIIDCIYRDTLIEKHNTRDTKPPLSAWAVMNIYKKDKDLLFIKEMYPKILKYHNWWYKDRDFDGDGLCEYGSTDGSLVAAKWESGMDNAIRFDNSKLLQKNETTYSLNQESVDLNAYLYAEKIYLSEMAKLIKRSNEANKLKKDAHSIKLRIQEQFFDKHDGWFYDTSIDGSKFIKGEGSEGWTALWAKVASDEQAETVIKKMLDPTKFYTKVPFQTMSADHAKFDPLNGYWRGPNWLDQAYFGVKGLRNYGYHSEANAATLKILNGAEGLLKKGPSIRENYHPITGQGLHAKNFSWSAAHIMMLLTNEIY